MGVTIRISRPLIDGIISLATNMPGEECCGLLLSDPGPLAAKRVDAILPARNVATDRTDRFEIDPALLIRAHRAERMGGQRIVGCYHSHPGGNPSPSAQDAAQADANGWLWLICAGVPWTATLWRAVPDGMVQGRFDPVTMIVDPSA